MPSLSIYKLYKFGKKRNVKVFSDATECYQGSLKSNPLMVIFKRIDSFFRMRIVNKKIDGVISISDFLYQYYKKAKVNTIKIPPLVDHLDRKWRREIDLEKKTSNILYIGGFKLPDKNAAAHRVLSNSKILKELGYNVILLGVTDKINMQTEDIYFNDDNIKMFENPYPIGFVNWIKYLFNITSIVKLVNEYNPQAVILYNFPAFTHLLLIPVFNKNKLKVIADCTEWYDSGEGNFFKRIIKEFDTFLRMRWLNFKVDGIIVISKYLQNFYKSRPNILLPPLVDLNDKKYLFNNLREDDEIVFVYAGQMGNKDRIVNILKELSHIWDEGFRNFKFDIIGLTENEFLDNNIIDFDYKKFLNFHGKLPHSEVLKRVSSSDFAVFTRADNRVNNAGFPTKLVEAFSCGIPVITNKTSNISDYLQHSKNGFFLDLEEDLMIQLKSIINLSREDINRMKTNCKNEKRFHYQFYKKEFSKFINEIRMN